MISKIIIFNLALCASAYGFGLAGECFLLGLDCNCVCVNGGTLGQVTLCTNIGSTVP